MKITGKQLKEDGTIISDIIRKYDENAGGICMLTVDNDEGNHENAIMASGSMAKLAYMLIDLCENIAKQIGDTVGKAWFLTIVKQVCEELGIDPRYIPEAFAFVKAMRDEEEDEGDAEGTAGDH